MLAKFISTIILLSSISSIVSASDSSSVFVQIDESILDRGIGVLLDNNWKYSPGDDTLWADPNIDDSDWEIISSTELKNDFPDSGFDGIGWFRIHIKIDSTLINYPLGFSMLQAGASEIYLNGKLIQNFGVVGNAKNEKLKTDRTPNPIKFNDDVYHVIAIRYSNHKYKFFNDSGFKAGFSFTIDDLFDLLSIRESEVRITTITQFSLIGISVVLAFFHLVLFLYDKRFKVNIYYVGFLISFASFVFIKYQADFFLRQTVFVYFVKFQVITVLFTVLMGAFTVFSNLNDFPKYSKFLTYTAILIGLFSLIVNWSILEIVFYSFILLTLTLTAYRLFHKKHNNVHGISIIRIGYAIMILGLVYRMLNLLDLVGSLLPGGDSYIYGVLSFVLAMSILIADTYTKTKKDLELKLVEVKDLSEKTLMQERAAKEQEIKQQLLEADNNRKTEELEEARRLQLSMLPKSIPEYKEFDIAVSMNTATEVGGDYYDFNLVKDDHLTVAIGDATGHGTKAGIMVSTIKGLFSAFVDDLTIVEFFNKCTATIKRMELDKMLMSFTLIRLWENKFSYCAAGMPPIYLYKKEVGEVKEILIQGMPLGAMKKFPYKMEESPLKSGDVILLMSDGFPEQQNSQNEMYDYPKTKDFFKECAHLSSIEIIEKFNAEADIWRGSRALDDDTTFIVIKKN